MSDWVSDQINESNLFSGSRAVQLVGLGGDLRLRCAPVLNSGNARDLVWILMIINGLTCVVDEVSALLEDTRAT